MRAIELRNATTALEMKVGAQGYHLAGSLQSGGGFKALITQHSVLVSTFFSFNVIGMPLLSISTLLNSIPQGKIKEL